MKRRVVFSIDKLLGEQSGPEAARIVCSKGMEEAASFASRFSILALTPWTQVFTSGTPEENGYLYLDTPARKELLEAISHASIISIRLKYEPADCYDGKDKRAINCEVSFRRAGVVFQTMRFFFLLEDGDMVQNSVKGCYRASLPPQEDNLEDSLRGLEESSLFNNER